ncbi:MAG TPA: hypothetical protein VFD32_12450 [Dehalococcoidia bacterium]|nr:hypothetical protein [Dehalococcoidia bacterium]
MRLSADDRRILARWVDRAVVDLAGPHAPMRRVPAFDWRPLLHDALCAYAMREPLRFLAGVIRAVPPGHAIDLGPLSSDLCEALLAQLRATPDGEARAAIAAVERLLRYGHNRSPDVEPGAP